MAKSKTKKTKNKTTGNGRPVRDLGVKASAGVKGGSLFKACATGEHYKEVTLN